MRATAVYLHVHHLLPYGRLAGLFADLFGCRPAAGTLPRFVGEAAARAGPLHGKVREAVVSSGYMHNDETGLGVLAKTSWLHVACTREYAFFEVTPGRSFEDIRSVVLEGYRGRSVHDFLPAYLKFEGVEHGLCNAHHLRDLAFFIEQSGNTWPEEMAALLLEAKKHTGRAASAGGAIPARTVKRLRARYMETVAAGYGENPEPEREPGKKGRRAGGKERCLLDRFAAYEEETLAFLLHGVTFDNNEAERDLRMMKTRQKTSGCFRSLEWSNRFAKVRSVTATARKKKVDVYALLKKLFTDPAGAEEMLFAT